MHSSETPQARPHRHDRRPRGMCSKPPLRLGLGSTQTTPADDQRRPLFGYHINVVIPPIILKISGCKVLQCVNDKGTKFRVNRGGGGGEFAICCKSRGLETSFELEGLLYYSSTFKIKCQVTFQLSLSRDYKKAFLETDLALALVD